MNDKSDKRPVTEESGDLIQTEQKSQRILGRDEPGIFDHDVETAGSFKSRGGGLNQLAGPLTMQKWLGFAVTTSDPSSVDAWGLPEAGRAWFNSTDTLFKFWDGTQILGLMSGPVEGVAEGAIPFGGVGGGFLDEDNVNLIWNDTLNVLEVMAPTKNTYIGKGVIGAGNSTGDNNVYVGYEAGYANEGGGWNVFMGYLAGRKNTSGPLNTLVGYYAGYEITTSQMNTCIGAHAGQTITTGQGLNVCIGRGAGTHTTGKENVSVGVYSGTTPTTGSRNVCIGYDAEANAANAWYRIAIGFQAQSNENNLCAIGGFTEAASVSVAIFANREFRWYDYPNTYYVGFKAPELEASKIWVLPATDGGASEFLQTDGEGNLTWAAASAADEKVKVDAAATAGYLGATSDDGVLITIAPLSYTDGGDFVILGVDGTVLVDGDFASAGFMMTDGAGTYSILPGGENTVDHNVFMGTGAGTSLAVGGQGNVMIGESAGNAVTTSDYSIFIGYQAGLVTTGEKNLIIGAQAGLDNTTATHSVLMGYQAGFNQTNPTGNVAIGSGAMFTNITGFANMAIGQSAGYFNLGSYNVFLGKESGAGNTTGASNTYIGYRAGYLNQSGASNVFIGASAGVSCGIAASENVAIGAGAGNNVEGQRNVYIGRFAGYTGTTEYYSCVIGSYASYFNQTGDRNVIIGYLAAYGVTGNSHQNNVIIGQEAAKLITTGSNNTIIGTYAGHDLTSGSGNVIIGYYASDGSLTTQNNQLWIANSNTATPLIYGEFDNGFITINGYLNITTLKSGATQGAAGAAANELWYTVSHATLPDNVVMMGV